MNWLFISRSKMCPRTSSFDYKFFKDDIYLGSCGIFKLEENVDDFINGENDYPEYHDQIDFLSTSSVSSIADDVTAFINIGVTWDSIDN